MGGNRAATPAIGVRSWAQAAVLAALVAGCGGKRELRGRWAVPLAEDPRPARPSAASADANGTASIALPEAGADDPSAAVPDGTDGPASAGLVQAEPAPEGIATGPSKLKIEPRYIDELPGSPPPLSAATNLAGRADWLQEAVFLAAEQWIGKTDAWFGRRRGVQQRTPVAPFRLGVAAEYFKEEDWKFRLDGDASIDISLPNAEEHLRLFLTTEALDELPATDATDRDGGLRIGLGKDMFGPFEPAVGLSLKAPPELFGRLALSRRYHVRAWRIVPGIRGYWQSDDGFGSIAQVRFDRYWGRWFGRSVSAVKWGEKTDGVEAEQSLVAGYAWALIEGERYVGLAEWKDIAHGLGLRATVRGHKTDETVADSYRLTLAYRSPLHRTWLYGTIAPEVKWDDERDWDAEPGIKVAVDVLFWGPRER